MKFSTIKNRKGFTLIELLLVIAILGVLVTLIAVGLQSSRNKAYTSRALSEFRSFAQAMELYLLDNNNYPPDADRNVPAGLEEYLGPGTWPDGPYPGSVYDWDNITDPAQYIQISLRFCDIAGNNCNFPTETWADDFDAQSAMYWCFEGPCRSHRYEPIDHPGYCVNCGPAS